MRSRKLLKSTAVVSVNTLLSRVLGFIRDMIIALVFGAGLQADAFFVAFRIPNLFRRLFAEGAFSQAFVPVLAEHKASHGDAGVRELAAHVAGALALILLLVTGAGVLTSPLLVMAFAPGFIDQSDKFQLTVEMTRICFPYLLFISMTSLCAGLLNTYGRFAVPAFTPVLLNLSLIGSALWLAPYFSEPAMALAVGVFIAGVVQFAFQLPFLARLGLLVRPRFNYRHPQVRKILRLIVPALVGVSVAQINLLVDTLIASFLRQGSVSWLYYSDRVMEFPLGVFGIALATVLLPNLSRQFSKGSQQGFSDNLDWALRWVILIGPPAALGLGLLAVPILSTLFQYGAFSGADVRMAGLSLSAFAVGLVGFVAVKILAPGFYARQDMKTPVRIALVAMSCNLVLNLILMWPLAHVGLALATSCSALLNAALLYGSLCRHGILKLKPGWNLYLLRVAMACSVMVAFLIWQLAPQSAWIQASVAWRVTHLAELVVGGGVLYFASLWLFGVRPRQLAASQLH